MKGQKQVQESVAQEEKGHFLRNYTENDVDDEDCECPCHLFKERFRNSNRNRNRNRNRNQLRIIRDHTCYCDCGIDDGGRFHIFMIHEGLNIRKSLKKLMIDSFGDNYDKSKV